MKKILALIGIVAVVVTGYLAFTAVAPTSTVPVAVAAGPTYSAVVYVAGMGGHFAKADVVIDPSDEKAPVKIKDLDRVVIGDKEYATHDPRIDVNDPNTMFWSTYVPDKNKKIHVGKTNLKDGKVLQDVALTPDPKAPAEKAPAYCASGQSKGFYMPVFMGQEGYVDVIDKKDMSLKHRVWVSDLGYAKGTYKFTHGINSPDLKTFLLVLNQAKEGKGTGDIDFVLVDMAALEQGKFKQVAKATLKGEPDKTITFRQYFTHDGKHILQSAGDRLWVVDAKTLAKVDEKMMPPGAQIHDAMPTPDNKFALLTVRNVTEGCDVEGKPIQKEGKTVDITDGVFMLYDASAKKLYEKNVSTCLGCHKGVGLGDKNAVLCGLDANYKK
ncbi:MAG: hypothetical protein M0042_10875 [Nitrospiraceae bacterium]|nr:hypothetical protein [Nitrospiraceae bacterium]